MSGVEILGVAASVIQVAEAGMRLSVKLFSFTRKVKRANKDIEALSHEIAITGAALQELGGTLSGNQSRQLCSAQALATADRLINDCNTVFSQLESIVDPGRDEKKSGKVPVAQRLNFVFLESRIKELQANLERLKGSILVILNVLIFAQQLRTHEEVSVLKDQRQLIQTLVDENEAAQKRYAESLRLLTLADDADVSSAQAGSNGIAVMRNHKSAPIPKVKHPALLERDRSRIIDHGRLVSTLLNEISSAEYNIGLRHRTNLQDGVLDIHWRDWDTMRQRYGSEVFLELYDDFEDIARHWTDKADSEGIHDLSVTTPSVVNRPRRRRSRYRHDSVSHTGEPQNVQNTQPTVVNVEYYRRGFARKLPPHSTSSPPRTLSGFRQRVHEKASRESVKYESSNDFKEAIPKRSQSSAFVVVEDKKAADHVSNADDASPPPYEPSAHSSDEDMGFGLFDGGPDIPAKPVEQDEATETGLVEDKGATRRRPGKPDEGVFLDEDEDNDKDVDDVIALDDGDHYLAMSNASDTDDVFTGTSPAFEPVSLSSTAQFDLEVQDSSLRLLLEYSTLTGDEITELARGIL